MGNRDRIVRLKRPPSRGRINLGKSSVESKIPDEELQRHVLRLLKSKKLTAILNDDFPFSSLGTLARIRDGKFPTTHKVRSSFGLAGMVTVASCTNCGGAHPIRKCSPKKSKIECTATKLDLEIIKTYVAFFKNRESYAIA